MDLVLRNGNHVRGTLHRPMGNQTVHIRTTERWISVAAGALLLQKALARTGSGELYRIALGLASVTLIARGVIGYSLLDRPLHIRAIDGNKRLTGTDHLGRNEQVHRTNATDRRPDPLRTNTIEDPVEEASKESFPASDPPAWMFSTITPSH